MVHYQHANVQPWLAAQRNPRQPSIISQPQQHIPKPTPIANEPALTSDDQVDDQSPSYLKVNWYCSETVRAAAHDIHNRIYIPSLLQPNAVRYDTLFRPIITCAIEWSDVFGPFLAVRMWRWTGYFAPGGEGMVVERFLGRHGLRDRKTRKPTALAYQLHCVGFHSLEPTMIKLPPNGTAKLNVPVCFTAGYENIEVFLEGIGSEVVESALWEGNLKGHIRSTVRDARLPLREFTSWTRDQADKVVMHLRLASETTPFRPCDVSIDRGAYEPHAEPIPVLGRQAPPQTVEANTYFSTAPIRTPTTVAPALLKIHISPSETLLATPAGGDIHLHMQKHEEEGSYRVGVPTRGPR